MSLLRLRELYRFSSSRKFRRSRSWTSIRLLAVLAIFISILFSIRVVTNPLRASLTRKKVELPLPTRSPTRYRGSVPIVDREKYEEVEARMRYYAQYDGGDPNFEEWIAPPNPFSPPKVTGIPEPPRPATELWSDQKADSQFCPVHSGCRFLLPVWYDASQIGKIVYVTPSQDRRAGIQGHSPCRAIRSSRSEIKSYTGSTSDVEITIQHMSSQSIHLLL